MTLSHVLCREVFVLYMCRFWGESPIGGFTMLAKPPCLNALINATNYIRDGVSKVLWVYMWVYLSSTGYGGVRPIFVRT